VAPQSEFTCAAGITGFDRIAAGPDAAFQSELTCGFGICGFPRIAAGPLFAFQSEFTWLAGITGRLAIARVVPELAFASQSTDWYTVGEFRRSPKDPERATALSRGFPWTKARLLESVTVQLLCTGAGGICGLFCTARVVPLEDVAL